jgi:hypothetical protein
MAMQRNGFALEVVVSPRTRCGASPCAGCAVRACARARTCACCAAVRAAECIGRAQGWSWCVAVACLFLHAAVLADTAFRGTE